MANLGIDLRRLVTGFSYSFRFLRDLFVYRRAMTSGRFSLRLSQLYPILSDFKAPAGQASGHYFHQDLWAARKIYDRRPKVHVDVGSRVDGFVAHLLTFMAVTEIDIRPLKSEVPGLEFVRDDATEMSTYEDNSVDSVSSLHVVEHMGLGRYGDPIDPDAWLRCMRSFARVLAPRGRLYLSVPIGQERLEFNAHRVFDPTTVLETLSDLHLVSFAGVNDRGELVEDQAPSCFRSANEACGLFEFTKLAISDRG
jgi:SAM-dependent methyltransferase